MTSTQIRLLEAVAGEAAESEEFKAALLEMLGAPVAKKTAKRARVAAPIDPIKAYLDGTLETEAAKLTVDELKAVIRENALDTARITAGWKDAEKLTAYLVDRAKARATKGNVFLNYKG